MALHARDANDLAGQLIVLSDRLKELVQRETALFEQRKPHEALSFASEKNTLATTYRLETARIARNPALLDGATDELKRTLRQATKALDDALRANNRATVAVRTLTEGLVKAIADEAVRMRQSVKGYGANGTLSTAGSAAAITLNRQV